MPSCFLQLSINELTFILMVPQAQDEAQVMLTMGTSFAHLESCYFIKILSNRYMTSLCSLCDKTNNVTLLLNIVNSINQKEEHAKLTKTSFKKKKTVTQLTRNICPPVPRTQALGNPLSTMLSQGRACWWPTHPSINSVVTVLWKKARWVKNKKTGV